MLLQKHHHLTLQHDLLTKIVDIIRHPVKEIEKLNNAKSGKMIGIYGCLNAGAVGRSSMWRRYKRTRAKSAKLTLKEGHQDSPE